MDDLEKALEQLSNAEAPARKQPLTNAEKQKRYRERQKDLGKKEVRGYLNDEALKCYQLISEQTQWTDSKILTNALRLTYAAYKNGQIGLLSKWLQKNNL